MPCATSPQVPNSEAGALHLGSCWGWHGDDAEPLGTALGADICPYPQLHCSIGQSSWDGAALCIVVVSGEQILLCSGWKSLGGGRGNSEEESASE